MSTVEFARALADAKHKGQVDKAGQPYISHPERVAGGVDLPEEKIVGWLHDVLEDTDTTPEELLSYGFAVEIVEAIQALTKQPGESRYDAVRRTVKNKIAVSVKIADVRDNMDLARLPFVTEKDLKRQEEYKVILEILLNAKSSFENFGYPGAD